ncbi:tetratricopeptide repeat protein [Streptomyces sp. NPDC050422]|uniref:tetratricopeptide repeat protein n=1 Tax=Streptomyces sp. NPDC050422 TaxID=3365614 RepID=UPI0037AA9600
MLDPISLSAVSAVTTVLGAVGSGMANEAGKWAWESTGGFVRRIAGREVPAPTTPGELDDVARLMVDQFRRDPRLAASWTAFAARMNGGAHGAGGGAAFGAGRPSLPVPTRFFTDRKEALKALDREASRRADGTPRLALVHGAEGMGTSELAVHWGTRQAGRFPDGQLHTDLGASSGPDGVREPGAVLRDLLRQLGLPAEEMPTSAAHLGEYFRRCVADRKLLIILDHAHSAAQVRPLLTSAPAVFMIVVARNPFPGLDAVRVPVGPLTDKDAVRLLTKLLDKPALAEARATLPSVLARCGGSPYALRAAAPRLTVPASGRTADADPVRGAAEDTYRLLEPATARLYRLMAVRAWPAVDAASAAHVTGTTPEEAAAHLEKLAAVLLLECNTTADGPARYHYRAAVRRHAEAVAVQVDGIAGCSAAMARMLNRYVDLSTSAAHQALPESWRVPAPSTTRRGRTYESRGEALDALIAESGNLVQAVHCAEESGDPQSAVRICRSLWPLQLKAGHHEMLLPALRIGARLADTHWPGTAESGALYEQLAHTLTELRRWEEAETEALAAARAEEAAGHRRGHASAAEFLGLLRLRQWRWQEAYACFDEAGSILDTMLPTDEGTADVPRARALLERHRGRALRGQGRFDDSRGRLETALRYFRDHGDTYNTARTLTDLAETWLDTSETRAARPLIEEAITTLDGQSAEYHVAYLRGMRERCAADERRDTD